jgi:catechol 2,3-dioxygenase-like lactoylglutathione lyase family enzyme
MSNKPAARIHYENSQPILRVENMEKSLRFYVDVLGFKNAAWGDENFTSVNRDGAGIYLCRDGQGRGGAWGVARGRGRGTNLRGAKTTQHCDPHAAYEFSMGARDANRRPRRERAAAGFRA